MFDDIHHAHHHITNALAASFAVTAVSHVNTQDNHDPAELAHQLADPQNQYPPAVLQYHVLHTTIDNLSQAFNVNVH